MITSKSGTIQDIMHCMIDHANAHESDVKDYTTADLDVDWDTYFQLEKLGKTQTVLIYNGTTLVGYGIFIIQRHIHHRTLMGVSTIVYISPAFRGRGLIRGLLETSEKLLMLRGVHTMVCSVTKTADYSKQLKKQGFEVMETNFIKELVVGTDYTKEEI